MFGLGTWELVLVLGGAVLFIGPDKLPELAKTLGRSMRSVQKAMSGVDETMRPVHNAARKINESIDDAMDLEDEAEQAGADAHRNDDAPISETNGENGEHDSEESDGRVATLDPFMPIPELEEEAAESAEAIASETRDLDSESNQLDTKDESPT